MNLKVIRVICILSVLLTAIWYVNAADAAKEFCNGWPYSDVYA